MECPFCGADSRVLDSRRSGDDVRRRRECVDCARRFTTYERVAPIEIRVLKRSGQAEDFDRAKPLRVVERVTRDRPVSDRQRRDLVRGLEAELLDARVPLVTSARIADRLLARLGELDRIAAARFSSNYLQEDGSIRTAPGGDPSQLALPLAPGAGEAAPPAQDAPEPPARRARGRRRA